MRKKASFWFFFLLFLLALNASSILEEEPNQQLSQLTKDKKASNSGFLSRKSKESVLLTRKSWGDKFAESFYFCFFGVLLFVWSLPVIWFNERRAVRTSEIITEGFRICCDLDISELHPKNNGRLVYLSGMAENPESVKDAMFGVSIEKSLKLFRKVEMLQFKEEKSTKTQKDWFGEEEKTLTKYNYRKVWEDTPIDSNVFNDHNFRNSNPQFVFQNESFYTNGAHIGAFEINKHQLEKLRNFKRVAFQGNIVEGFSIDCVEKIGGISSMEKLQILDNYLYIRNGEANVDNIGDYRISFNHIPEEFLSKFQCFFQKLECSVEEDEEICCFNCIKCCTCVCCMNFVNCCLCCGSLKTLCKAPTTIDWLYEQRITKAEIFELRANENRLGTWFLRVIGFLLMLFGMFLFFSPVSEFLEILPLLSSLGKALVFVFALLVTIPVFSLIMLFAWLFYRPKIALVFFAVILTFAMILFFILRKSKETITEEF